MREGDARYLDDLLDTLARTPREEKAAVQREILRLERELADSPPAEAKARDGPR